MRILSIGIVRASEDSCNNATGCRWGAACVGTPRVGCATSAVGRDDRLGDRLGARAGHGALVEAACFRRPPAAVST